jgi:hypothetical protein
VGLGKCLIHRCFIVTVDATDNIIRYYGAEVITLEWQSSYVSLEQFASWLFPMGVERIVNGKVRRIQDPGVLKHMRRFHHHNRDLGWVLKGWVLKVDAGTRIDVKFKRSKKAVDAKNNNNGAPQSDS